MVAMVKFSSFLLTNCRPERKKKNKESSYTHAHTYTHIRTLPDFIGFPFS